MVAECQALGGSCLWVPAGPERPQVSLDRRKVTDVVRPITRRLADHTDRGSVRMV